MKKQALIAGLFVVSATVLAGCATSTALEAGTQKCEDALTPEIRQTLPEPEAGWGATQITPKVTAHRSRDGSEYVYDIAGTADIQTAGETTFTVNWECFTQTTDGTTYAEVTVKAG